MKPSRVLLGALLTVLAGCGDSTGPGALSGSLSFSHSGATSGTFSAVGSPLGADDPFAATWSAAVRDDANQTIDVAANIARSGNTSDNAVVHFPQLTVGSVAIANGAQVLITFGRTQSGSVTWSCSLTAGSVVVTTVSAIRARGTFAGNGTCVGTSGGPSSFTVTNGSFDVPLVSGF